MATVGSDKPLGCLNCKTRVKIGTRKCPGCGDILTRKIHITTIQPVIEKPVNLIELAREELSRRGGDGGRARA